MQVTFTRTGERTYSIAARRPGGEVLHMPRGPGYDPWLLHDLVHFVVERHFEIARGVFGQLAAGGDAGTFFTIPHRRRDPARRLSRRLGVLGLARLPEALLAELDEVAALWHALPVGEALTLAWPARLTIRPGGSPRGRRPNRDRGMAARRR
jgi:hypothetical protein